MSDYSFDLNNVLGTQQVSKVAENSTDKKAGSEMGMDDFLMLMVAQFQNQSIDNTADTTEMMNQMVQMSVIQAVTNLKQLIGDSTSMTYAASLVGKEVTIGLRSGKEVEEMLGTVTGTGTLNGEQVIFLDNKETPYALTDIMAVGRLPEVETKQEAAQRAADALSEMQQLDRTQETEEAQEAQEENAERDPHTPDETGALG